MTEPNHADYTYVQGHINHSLFWKNLAPTTQGGGQLSEGPLKDAIERDFGSFESTRFVTLTHELTY